ncbi:MAG: glycine betaine ABC transporter substrate-binding protein [Desulfobacterales bacterium]
MFLQILKRKLIPILIVMVLSAVFWIDKATASETVKLAYVPWSSEIASSYLVKAVLEEKLGYHCQLVDLKADKMWEAVATGKADAMVSAWLPDVHGHYYDQFKDQVVNLGPNLQGTKAGLVVPDISVGRFTTGTGLRNRPILSVNTIAELKEHTNDFRSRIIGIDREAGIMKMAQNAIEVYGLDNFRLIEGSEVSMIAELSHAIRHRRSVAVTGWTPHWIFARWQLKFLEDPENIFGDKGHINTIVRKKLQSDMPEVYRFLDRFHWKPEQMEQLMMWNQQEQGLFPYENALRWINTNKETVSSWLK